MQHFCLFIISFFYYLFIFILVTLVNEIQYVSGVQFNSKKATFKDSGLISSLQGQFNNAVKATFSISISI